MTLTAGKNLAASPPAQAEEQAEEQAETGGGGSGRPGSLLIRTLEWAYDTVIPSLPGLGTVEEFADHYLGRSGGSPEQAIDALIAWQVRYAGLAGFMTNIGGLVTLPAALPANLASVSLIQLRMVAAIARLRGYDPGDRRVKYLAFACLTGRSFAKVLEEAGVSIGSTVGTRLLTPITGAAIGRINRAVGSRLLGRAGAAGSAAFARIVPVLGGAVVGAIDAAMTRAIAEAAKKAFPPAPAAADQEAASRSAM